MKPKDRLTTRRAGLVALLLPALLLCGCGEQPESAPTTTDLTPAEAQAIAKEAYLYGFPMVMNYKTMWNYAIDSESPDYKGPFNQKSCLARLFTPEDKAVVTPNADTPYCMFWMDLRSEPLVLSVPKMEPNRFYHFQLVDLYTHNYAYIGTLTTGNDAGKFLIVGPDWNGEKPEGITDVIKSETSFVFDVTRTQLIGPDDLEKVKAIQASYDLQPLSAFLGAEAPAAAPQPNFPKWDEGSQFDERFFGYLDFMMLLLGSPGEGEQELWDKLARLGIGAESDFDFAALPAEIQEALKAGVKEGFSEIEKFVEETTKDPLVSGKIFGTRDFLTKSAKQNYQLDRTDILRSAAAQTGLYGNSAEEAIYPTYLVDADGEPLDASKQSYTLTFEKDALPPVKAFWSVTMYDGKTQLFIDNPLDRYLINSTNVDGYVRGEDGSLVFHISKESPGKDLEANWLPAPDGPFYLVMRLYGPGPEVLSGGWSPPAVMKATATATSSEGGSAPLSDAEVENLVKRSYQYVAMYNVNNKFAITQGGWNTVAANTELKDHTMRDIARPNNDSLYVGCMLDLRKDPVILDMPAFDSKYVSLMVTGYDHYVNIPMATREGDFGKPEKMLFFSERTEGYQKGEKIEGIDRYFECTGDFISAVFRVMPHANEPERFERIVGQMKAVKLMTLSEFRGGEAKPVDDVAFPPLGKKDADIFENNLLEVMQFVFNHTTFDPDNELDQALLAAYEPLGVVPGQAFAASKVAKIDGKRFREVSERIFKENVAKSMGKEFQAAVLTALFQPKGSINLDALLFQSIIGPVGQPAQEALYPMIVTADGQPMNAQHDYVIRMSKDELPPAEAFWSATLYDTENGFFIPNDHKKYSVGENGGMKLDDDGGIEIHIAAEKPEGVPEENWLPLVRGDYAIDVVMRLYVPDLEKFKTWNPPKAEKVN